MSTSSTVPENQLYRDLAPDMKARDRRLRVTAVRDGRADVVVEHDLGGQAGRKTHASIARLRSAAFELLEDPADTDPQYLAMLAAVAEVHRPGATPPDCARAALRVLRDLLPAGPAVRSDVSSR
ncbi:DUF6354 family protein [Streptomyces sp. NPDC046866]|uniref:DUF6354 family protein n=1 Tax=Streptomyces sp. NPDC046866 TaxID=3154921 RepID=UPI003451C3BE